MPITSQPQASDLHVDRLLSMVSVAYMNPDDAYVSDQVFPTLTVNNQTDQVARYKKEDFFKNVAQLRAPGTKSDGYGWRVDSALTYHCLQYATHIDVPDEVRGNADSPYAPDREASMLVTQRLKMKRELAWATDFFKTGVWGTDVVGGTGFTKWDNYGSSNPIIDFQTGVDTIHSTTAIEARNALFGRAVWNSLKHHPLLIDRIKYTQRGILSKDIIAALLDLDKIVVGNAIYATNQDGATEAYDYVFGKNCLLYYTPSRPGLMVPSIGYTFHWRVFGGLSAIRRVRLVEEMADRIIGYTAFDHKAIATDVGYFFSAAVD